MSDALDAVLDLVLDLSPVAFHVLGQDIARLVEEGEYDEARDLLDTMNDVVDKLEERDAR